jgi:hypothetical protein
MITQFFAPSSAFPGASVRLSGYLFWPDLLSVGAWHRESAVTETIGSISIYI